MTTKHEVLKAHIQEWLATKPYTKERRALVAQLAAAVKIHPRSVGRALRRLQTRGRTREEARGRPTVYTKDVDAALYQLWESMDYPCAENMQPMIDTYVTAFVAERQWDYREAVTALITGVSQSTLKRRIALWRAKHGIVRGYSATVPSPLKDLIPIRKSHTWHELPVGYLQIDSVVHCGDRLTADVIYSVGGVDFKTYWSEYTAQWNKGEVATQESLATIRERFPFAWCELHPDTGSEFINYHLARWAATHQIALTRSEPYKKNDNMCIEERNNTIPRRHVGYVRLDDESLVPLVSEILRVACLIHNHFRPVRRMVAKRRIGAKWHRTYERVAKTPYQRLLDDPDVPAQRKQRLVEAHDALNPLQLKRELDRLKAQLAKQVSK